ncbi:MAG: heparinase II/III family protein [Pseudomonadota bacterium]
MTAATRPKLVAVPDPDEGPPDLAPPKEAPPAGERRPNLSKPPVKARRQRSRRPSLGELGYRAACLLYALPLYEQTLRSGSGRGAVSSVPDSWPGNGALGQDIVQGQILLAGMKVPLTSDFQVSADLPTPALDALHSFAWLRHLRAYGGDQGRRRARELVTAWIYQERRWSRQVWAPPVLAERLANLMGHYEFFAASGDIGLRQSLLRSLSRQAHHLMRCMPAGLVGADLITAIKGLTVAGAAVEGCGAALDKACSLLAKTLPRQVQADGGHIERSPALQLRILRDLLDIRAWLHLAEVEPPGALADAIQQMAPLLKLLQQADGGLALFNGAVEEEGLMIDLVLQRASGQQRQLGSAPQSGFQRLRAGRISVLVDAGRPPEPGLDFTSHAGTLSMEVTTGRQRLIVNCGAFPGSDTWAPLLRGTAAHSTLCLAERNSSEVLPSGGLGRRPAHVLCRRDERGGNQLLEVSHDGYQPLFGAEHHRRLALSEDGDALLGEDRLTGCGAGLPFALRFHLHPSVQASLSHGGGACLLRLPRGEGWRFRTQDMEIALEPSIYFGHPEEPRRSLQIVLSGETGPDGMIAVWWLQREGKPRR